MKLLFVFLAIISLSCGKQNTLSSEDYNWMPYHGTENLIFESPGTDSDSLHFIRKDTIMAHPDAAVGGVECEEVCVFSKNQVQRPTLIFFKVKKNREDKTELVFNLSTENAVFYRITPVNIDSLATPITFETSYKKYDDVFLIIPDEYAKDFYQRSDYVVRLYWSKSSGLIRYDRKDERYWELKAE